MNLIAPQFPPQLRKLFSNHDEREFTKMLTEYENYMKFDRELADSTIQLYLSLLKRFLEMVKKEITTVTKEDIRQFRSDLQSKGYARNGIANYIVALRSFFAWATYKHRTENIVDIYFYLDKIIRLKRDRFPIRRIPDNDVVVKIQTCMDLFLAAHAHRDTKTHRMYKRDRALFELLVTVGPRNAEVRALRVSDIRVDDSMLLIHGKGNKNREVYLPDKAKELVLEYIKLKGYKSDDLIFPVSDSGVEAILKRWEERAGVPPVFPPHTYRHFLSTAGQEQGLTRRQMADYLGHDSEVTTAVYTHLPAAHKRKIYGPALNRVVEKSETGENQKISLDNS